MAIEPMVPGTARAVEVVSDLLYVADGEGGLRVYDVTVAWAPFEVASYDSANHAADVKVSGNRAYLADFAAGMTVLAIECPFFADGFESGNTWVWSSTVGGGP